MDSKRIVECVIKYRRWGYSIFEVSRFCKCSEYMVRKILKTHGDPLKKVFK